MTADVFFLLDVDNTLLDGDRIVADLREHLKHEFGEACAQRYWAIFDTLRKELGYVDYLGALQRYRLDIEAGRADEPRLLMMSTFLIDYPFADRLCARSRAAITPLGPDGPPVLCTDGRRVFPPAPPARQRAAARARSSPSKPTAH